MSVETLVDHAGWKIRRFDCPEDDRPDYRHQYLIERMAGHSEGMWLSDKEYHVLRKILEMAHLKENEGRGMTHHRAIIISPNSVETIEIGGNAEKAESYEMWVRSNYTVIDIKTFGDINGADYVVMYYVKGRISK